MATKLTDKLLVVEEDAILRRGLVEFFEDNGFEVIPAENVAVALKKFQQETPDLVLTTLDLPLLDGKTLLEILSKNYPNTPVVVASKPTSMQDIIEALRHGAWDYVAKPYANFQVVEHVISRALERARLVAENKRYRQQLEETNEALKKSLNILREDQEAGRSVQMRMLPEQNLSFGTYVFSHNVTPSLYLSGDFLDYFKINDSTIGFYIADVSGHGASSAFVTVLLKSLIALSLTKYQLHDDQIILAPEKLLSFLASEINGAKLGKYLTIVYGTLDFTKHRLTYSVGGHFPTPIWVKNHEAKYLEGKGFPVGILPKTSYQSISLDFPNNAHLVLFSDGILEIMPETDLPAKEKTILKWVAEGDGSIDFLKDRFKLNDSRIFPDDVTVLIVKRQD